MIHHVRLSSTRSANQLFREMSQTRLTVLEIQYAHERPQNAQGSSTSQILVAIQYKATALPIFLSPNAPTQITGATKVDLEGA